MPVETKKILGHQREGMGGRGMRMQTMAHCRAESNDQATSRVLTSCPVGELLCICISTLLKGTPLRARRPGLAQVTNN
jgi:hypothetical protein